uniref:SKP1 component POZ domain-containing protein n=1 Tax=Anopheles christyi TaxID=43041 RepID=A0A182KEP9_9DIPT
MDTIKLKAKDGEIVTVQRNLLKHSSVLEKKLEELDETAEAGAVVEVPEADGNSLGKIIQWLEQCKGNAQSDGTEKNNYSEEMEIPNNQEQNVNRNAPSSETIAPIDKEYFTNFRQFCVLIAVANRLKVQEFVDAAVRFVLEWKEGKSLDEIREMLEQDAPQVRPQNQPVADTEQMED